MRLDPGIPRVQSSGRRDHLPLPSAGREIFGSNYKSYRNLAPQSAQASSAHWAEGPPEDARPPHMNEIEFHGKLKDKLLNSINRSNMPHMKRIITNQVFLEETENLVGTAPILHEDSYRPNPYAIDAGSAILTAGTDGPMNTSAASYTLGSQMLPAIGPRPQDHNLFGLPRSTMNNLMPGGKGVSTGMMVMP